ncbi:MAG: type I-U CRISPR-associated protein Csx17 [Gemmatimonadetes bacterium]|nr:type I-U CRISPR-associated protein Csx17 [Gemmatimonadota bacterium]
MKSPTKVLTLEGCRSSPLLSYLQSFGVIRALHEQHLPEVLCYWKGSTLQIEGSIDRQHLMEFFLHRYKPAPIVSPWNGRGGFRIRKPQKGERAVQAITERSDSRLEPLQETIRIAKEVMELAKGSGWVDRTGKVKNKAKPLLLAACRSAFPDGALDWLDAVFVLSDDKSPHYPLMLGGTGGALGSGDIATNYLEAVHLLLDQRKTDQSSEWLSHALFSSGRPKLSSVPIGHFLPGTAKTVNSSAFGTAASAVNPWSFVLGMEGSLLFASGVARRFQGSMGMATTPFTVSKSPAEYLAAENETIKGELWLPTWERPMTVPEVRRILAEGRLSWGGKHASHGIDAAKAISTLGVDRGLNRFERYVVAVRFGDLTMAVPTGSFSVVNRPAERVKMLGELDVWVDRFRKAELPASARSALRRVDAAQIRVVRDPDSPEALQDCLAEVALLEWIVSRNESLTTRARHPIPLLSTDRWCSLLDDGTGEWKLAVAIATQRDHFNVGQSLTQREQRRGAALSFLRPAALPARPNRRGLLDWADRVPGSGNPVSWSTLDRLAVMLTNRAILCGDRQASERVQPLGSGAPLAFDRFSPVTMSLVATFLNGQIDDRRLGRLLTVTALLDRPPSWKKSDPHRDGSAEWQPITPARAVLGPFFHPQPMTEPTDLEEETETLLLPSLSWPQQLQAGQTDMVIREALIRLRAAGFRPAVRHEAFRGTSTERLIGSLLIPTYSSTIRKALEMVCPPVPDPTLEGES